MSHGCWQQTLNDKINMNTETNDGNGKEQQTLAPAGLFGGGDAPDFISEIRDIINKHSMENGSNTPDFILAQYLTNCLRAWNAATTAREKWYGREPKPCEPPNDQAHLSAPGGRVERNQKEQ